MENFIFFTYIKIFAQIFSKINFVSQTIFHKYILSKSLKIKFIKTFSVQQFNGN
jgi:hypothetical protein